MSRLIALYLLFATLAVIYSKPVIKSHTRSCFTVDCPTDTFACEKFTKISADKKNLETEIRCLGANGEKLLKKNITSENPYYGSQVTFQSYSYRSFLQFTTDSSDSGEPDENPRNEVHGNVDTEIIEKETKVHNDENSEVEDLNTV